MFEVFLLAQPACVGWVKGFHKVAMQAQIVPRGQCCVGMLPIMLGGSGQILPFYPEHVKLPQSSPLRLCWEEQTMLNHMLFHPISLFSCCG